MLIKRLGDCATFISGDGALLRELANARTQKRAFGYSLAHGVVKPGAKTKSHTLKTSEVYYILAGKGCMHVNDEAAEVGPDTMIDVLPHSRQYIENIGSSDLLFLCIVDPGWSREDEEVFE